VSAKERGRFGRLADGHDQKAADEMRQRHSEPDGGDVADIDRRPWLPGGPPL
jgi:hypothetical protein